jgi:protoporphyrinogen oxidase
MKLLQAEFLMSRIAILGCGWSGIIMAIRMKSLYPFVDVICIDKNLDGGLLRSEVVNGYLFDIGGSHIVFSRKPDVVESILSLGGEWVSRERKAFILLNGVFVPYPFETGIHVLPPELRVRYGLSIIRALLEYHNERPRNFLDWIVKTFGHDIAEDYLIPYNEKIWKRPLDQVSADWVYIPGRLPIPSIEDIVKAVAGIPIVGYKEQAVFYYPRRGGIIKQWEAAYRRAETLGVKFIEAEVREVKTVKEGYVVNGLLKAEKIINTLPLKEVPQIFNLSEDAHKVAARLDYNSVVVVGLGLKRSAPKQHWIYVPDKKIVFHRYAWISNYGEDMPPDKASLIAEITVSPNQKVDLDKLINETIQDFIGLGVIKNDEIKIAKAWHHKYGYPIYTLTHREDVDIITQELTEIGVVTFGRWGNWQYWNTDKIFEKVLEIKLTM